MINKIKTDDFPWDKYYDDIYSDLSEEAHGKTAMSMMGIDSGRPYRIKIRNVIEIKVRVVLICALLSTAFSAIIEFYLPKDHELFKKYISKLAVITKKKNCIIEQL
jgi:hypothetical protein